MRRFLILSIPVLLIFLVASIYYFQSDSYTNYELTEEEEKRISDNREKQERKEEDLDRPIEEPVIIKNQGYHEYTLYSKSPDNRWVSYIFSHEVNEENTQDNWRIKDIKVGDMAEGAPTKNNLDLVDEINITDSNNTHEYAYKELGSDDHIGNSHGKEIVEELKFTLDGENLDFENEKIYSGNELIISKFSNLYSEIDRGVQLAEVHIDYHFDSEGLTLNTTTNWIEDVNMEFAWVSLFPFIRGDEQSTMFRFLNSEEEYDISKDNTVVPRSDENGGILYNNENDLSVTIEVLDPQNSLNNYSDNGWAKSFVADSLGANKFYVGRVSGDTSGEGRLVEAGETWNVEQYWRIEMPE